jgi:DNA-binding MarR family transcriptional regulator
MTTKSLKVDNFKLGSEGKRRLRELSPLDIRIILELQKHYKVTMKELINALPAERTCVKVHVKRLVDKELILRCGSGRETWYEGVV